MYKSPEKIREISDLVDRGFSAPQIQRYYEIMPLVDKGYSTSQIARELDGIISRKGIDKFLHKHGFWDYYQKIKREPIELKYASVKGMINKGYSTTRIAKELGLVTDTGVKKYILRKGWKDYYHRKREERESKKHSKVKKLIENGLNAPKIASKLKIPYKVFNQYLHKNDLWEGYSRKQEEIREQGYQERKAETEARREERLRERIEAREEREAQRRQKNIEKEERRYQEQKEAREEKERRYQEKQKIAKLPEKQETEEKPKETKEQRYQRIRKLFIEGWERRRRLQGKI